MKIEHVFLKRSIYSFIDSDINFFFFTVCVSFLCCCSLIKHNRSLTCLYVRYFISKFCFHGKCESKLSDGMSKKQKNKLIFPTSVISFAFATGFLSDAALLWVVHHFLPCLAALGRWREELCEGIDEALGLVVEAQAAVWQVAVLPHGKKQPVVSGVTFAGGAGGRVCWGRALPPTAPSQLLKGPPRPAEDKSVRVKVTIGHTL